MNFKKLESNIVTTLVMSRTYDGTVYMTRKAAIYIEPLKHLYSLSY